MRALTGHTITDMMSDMKTFTVRELDRQPGVVLNAADKDGVARIQRRDGRAYLVRPLVADSVRMTALPDFGSRRKLIFKKALSNAQVRQADKLIAGE